MKFPTSRLVRTMAAVTLALGMAYAALAQSTSSPKNKQPASGPDIIEEDPANTSGPRR